MPNTEERDAGYTDCVPKFNLNYVRSAISQALSSITRWQIYVNVVMVGWFERLGVLVARRWIYFLLVPLLLGGIASTGLYDASFDTDFESLSLPIKGRWNNERQVVDRCFKEKAKQYFDPTRVTTLGQYFNLVIKASRKGGNILEKRVWSDIKALDETILETAIQHEGKTLKFNDICSPWKGSCFSPLPPIRPDELSSLAHMFSKLSEQTLPNLNLKSSKYINFLNFSLALILGKPKFNDDGVIESAEAISLFYWLRSDTDKDVERSRLWENQIMASVREKSSSSIDVAYFAARTPGDEMGIATRKMRPLLAISGLLMVLFVAATSSLKDNVRSKVVLSLVGIASVLLATGATFGILVYCGVSFIGINYAVVFLMLGIGIDDMFVLLSAFRATSIRAPVEHRLRETYGHACISISITSLTNASAFFVGTFSSVKTIQIFSIYSCFSSLMTFIFFVTFFGGALAAFGHLESHQRHSILCIKVKAKSASEHESFFYRHFLAGGINPLDPTNPLDNSPPSSMKRLSSGLGALHDKFTFKVWIIGSYFVYLLLIMIGVSRLEQEMHPDRVSFQESTFSYFQYYDEYFIQKPSFVQIVFSENMKYSSPDVREKIMDLHRSLEGLPFVEKEHTTSWIRDRYTEITSSPSLKAYLQSERFFINYVKKYSLTQKNRTFEDCHDMLTLVKKFREINFWQSNETRKILNLFHNFPCNGQDFLSTFVPQEYLRRGKEFVKLLDTLLWVNHYINKASSIYEMDVNLSETSKSIDSSRFLIVINNASDFHVQNILRKTVERSGISGAQVFNYPAFIIEQVQLVEFTTIISTISTTIIVLLISFVLIPNIICSIWVAFSIVSIELGVIGIMALWNVKLNAISMVNLIMCVGFSVDFSAHFSYAYVRANGVDSKDWTREALNSVGHPIILAGLSTIVGILPICFTDSDIFIIFFKIVLLVIILGVLHSLIYLPLFMRLFGPQSFGRYDLKKGISSKIVREAYQLRCCSGSFRLARPTNPVNQCSENCDICFKHKRPEVIPSKGVFYINCKPNNGEQRSICEACESYYLDDSDAVSLQPECEESLSWKCKKECSGRVAPQLDRNSVVTSADSAIELDFIESEKNVIIAPLDVKLL